MTARKATKGQAITTAVFAILKIVVGIIVFVLFKVLIDTAAQIQSYRGMTSPDQPGLGWWIFGLPFLVPGVMGCVAAGVRNRLSYGLYMAACIIACVVDAVFCFLSFVFLFAMADVGGVDCVSVAGQCVCSAGSFEGFTPATIGIADCADLSKVVHLSYGLCAMMIMGWLLCLAGSIVSCASCCCGESQAPGVVMMNSFPGQVVVSSSHYVPPQYPDGQYAVAPPPQYEGPSGGDAGDDKNQYKYNRMY